MFTYFKNDFASVRSAAQFFIPRLPLVVIVVWYVLLLPFGLLALIPIKIWYYIVLKNLKKEIEADLQDFLKEIEAE